MTDPYPVQVACRICGKPCRRGPKPPHNWYHLDDEVDLVSGILNYDHDADPDVIDV